MPLTDRLRVARLPFVAALAISGLSAGLEDCLDLATERGGSTTTLAVDISFESCLCAGSAPADSLENCISASAAAAGSLDDRISASAAAAGSLEGCISASTVAVACCPAMGEGVGSSAGLGASASR